MKPREILLPNVWGQTPLEWARQSNRVEVREQRRCRCLRWFGWYIGWLVDWVMCVLLVAVC
jgi:hypothetical protein